MDLNYGWRKAAVQKQAVTTPHLAIKKKGPSGTPAASLCYFLSKCNAEKCAEIWPFHINLQPCVRSVLVVQAVSVVGRPSHLDEDLAQGDEGRAELS